MLELEIQGGNKPQTTFDHLGTGGELISTHLAMNGNSFPRQGGEIAFSEPQSNFQLLDPRGKTSRTAMGWRFGKLFIYSRLEIF
jgi:hypothetical protein